MCDHSMAIVPRQVLKGGWVVQGKSPIYNPNTVAVVSRCIQGGLLCVLIEGISAEVPNVLS